MSDKQPEALNLSLLLLCDDCAPKWLAHKAAAELRRLHALNAELVEALEAAYEQCIFPSARLSSVYQRCTEVLSKAKEQ